MIYMGCHLSAAKGYEHMAADALKINANTFAFFTRNPRGGKAKALNMDDVERFNRIIKENKFGPLVAHAPYTLNPASAEPKIREFAYIAMKEDLARMEYTPGNYYNFHPGSHVGQGVEVGIEQISGLLNQVLTPEQSTTVLLETMAGKGTEIGSNFAELKMIIDRVELQDKIGICLDTCHVSDAGYDIINNIESVLDEFDRIIGLDKLKALHINDSKNPMGAHKDRHEKVGEGCIGLEPLLKVVNNPRLSGLPCILETPQDSLEGYGREIKLFREKEKNNGN